MLRTALSTEALSAMSYDNGSGASTRPRLVESEPSSATTTPVLHPLVREELGPVLEEHLVPFIHNKDLLSVSLTCHFWNVLFKKAMAVYHIVSAVSCDVPYISNVGAIEMDRNLRAMQALRKRFLSSQPPNRTWPWPSALPAEASTDPAGRVAREVAKLRDPDDSAWGSYCTPISFVNDGEMTVIFAMLGTSGVYSGGLFFLRFRFTQHWPFHPPACTFLTPVRHLNVSANGAIHIDILSEGWSPALTAEKIALSLTSLLDEAANEPCLGPVEEEEAKSPDDVVEDFMSTRARFRREVRELTRKAVIKEEVFKELQVCEAERRAPTGPLRVLLEEGRVEGLYIQRR